MSTIKADTIQDRLATEAAISTTSLLKTLPIIENLYNGNYKGLWKTSTTYALDDVIVESNVVYRCIVAHTSNVFASESANWKTEKSNPLTFDTVQDMIDSTKLKVGDVVETLYYNTSILQKWVIVSAATGTADGGSYIDLTGSGLQAKQIFPKSQPVDVRSFGALIDGVTDDTQAIVNAVNACKRVYISAVTGSECIVSDLEITNLTNFGIYGDGTLKHKGDTDTPTLEIKFCSKFKIRGITFDGNRVSRQSQIGDPATRNNGANLKLSACSGYIVDGVEAHNNIAGAGILAIDNGPTITEFAGRKSVIQNVYVHDCGIGTASNTLSDGMFINQDKCTVRHFHIHDCTDYGIAGDYAYKLRIHDFEIKNVLIGVGVLGAKDWIIKDGYIDTAGQGVSVGLSGNAAVAPYLSDGVLVKNVHMTNIIRDGSGTPNGDAVFIDPSALNVTVRDCSVDTAHRGLASDAVGTKFIDNRIKNVTDRHVFNSGAGSVSKGNVFTGTGLGAYYGTTLGSKDIDEGPISATTISSFIGGWSGATGSYETVKYYRKNGRVYLQGSVNSGTLTTGQPIFNLPAGYRPANRILWLAPESTYTTYYVFTVDSNGDVVYRAGTGGTNMSFTGLSFINT